MFQQVYGWIQNITVYLIAASAVMYAVPGKDYARYIRFFSGLILILLLTTPILNLFGMKGRFEAFYQSNEYRLEQQEIEKADEFYRNSGLFEYLQTEDDADSGKDDRQIDVGEIEIKKIICLFCS